MRRGSLIGLLACLTACVFAPGAAHAATVDAGAIRAVTTDDPWSLTLTDGAGAPVLAEHDGTGTGPVGTLGFRSLEVWRHATRVISEHTVGDTLITELETTDPLRTIHLELRPDFEGVIRLYASVLGPSTADVDSIGIGFDAPAGERYLGFGERSNAVAQSGVVENYVSDGPYQTEEYPFLNAFVPPWGLRERTDATYFPIPWLLSTAGYGVLVDNPQTSNFRIRSESADAWSAEVIRAPDGEPGAATADHPTSLSMRFFAGPEPADAVRRFTRDTGRQPLPAASWLYGPWFQPGNNEAAELDALRAADAPVSALQTYLHYLPCGAHEGQEAAQLTRTAAAHDRGAAITTYFNPMVCEAYTEEYDAAKAAGALTRNPLAEPASYRYAASPTAPEDVGQYDFFRQAGRDRYALLLNEAVSHGYDGWMEDFGEYTPLDSVSGETGDEIDGTIAHNPYAREYHCAAAEAVSAAPRPIIRFQRSGWTGVAPCATVVWGGDPTTDWGFDGLASAVTQSLNMGLSGISIWGSDIGGFFALGSNALSPELLKRWVQFGAFSGVMRTQRNGVALPPKTRPQVNDPDQIQNWRRYAKLRTQLYPYLVAAQEAYVETGMPLTRHMALVYPDDPSLAARDDQYMFGDDLLAAPVVTPGAVEREVALPGGTWIDLWRSVAYDEGTGGLRLGEAEMIEGGGVETLPAPLTELPLLVRSGAILPLLPSDVDTLADYGGAGVTNLSDRADQLELIAFPRGDSASDFYDDNERLISNESGGLWTLTVDGIRERDYRLQASLATLETPFEPCSVSLGGSELAPEQWSYDDEQALLVATFLTTASTLTVTEDCDGPGGGPGSGPDGQGQPGGGGGAGRGSATPRCGAEAATIVGTGGPDTLAGTPGDDVIAARAGSDRVRGRAGDDLICGGSGDDRLRGGRDDDALRGGAGSDSCKGGRGANTARHCEAVN